MVSKRKQIGRKGKGITKATSTNVKIQAKKRTKQPTGDSTSYFCYFFFA